MGEIAHYRLDPGLLGHTLDGARVVAAHHPEEPLLAPRLFAAWVLVVINYSSVLIMICLLLIRSCLNIYYCVFITYDALLTALLMMYSLMYSLPTTYCLLCGVGCVGCGDRAAS